MNGSFSGAKSEDVAVRVSPFTPKDSRPPLLISSRDKQRLDLLLDSPAAELSWEVTYFLAGELDRATIVDPERVPRDVVTLHARVRFRDEATGSTQEVTLVLPKEEDLRQGRLSVLTPVGTTLLGLSEGQTMRPPITGAARGPLTVLKVLSQPAGLSPPLRRAIA